MKTYTISNGKGYSENLEPGTTKAEAEAVLAALPEGWKLITNGNDDRKPARRKSTFSTRDRHGFWPTSAAVPRESALYRVLPSEHRVRMNDDPVVTMHLDPADRPIPAARTDHGSRCYCTDCLTSK